MEKKIQHARNYGLDLLRMIAMLMVVVLHILGKGGVLSACEPLSGQYELLWFLEIAAYCACNCYALISGYVIVDSKFRYSNIIALWLRIAFYTVGITVLFAFFMPETVGADAWKMAIFPVMTKRYWYVTAYFCLFFFIPLINSAIDKMSQIQLKQLIVALVVMFSILQTLFRNDVFGTASGYSPLWLIALYIMGAYIKKYNAFETLGAPKALLGYVICITITWVVKWNIEAGSQTVLGEMKNGNILVSYMSPTILGAGICLFLFFKKIRIGRGMQKVVKLFAPAAFSVYLIHAQLQIWTYVIADGFSSYASFPAAMAGAAVLGTAVSIYIVCSLVDLVREFIFRMVNVKGKLVRIEDRIRDRCV